MSIPQTELLASLPVTDLPGPGHGWRSLWHLSVWESPMVRRKRAAHPRRQDSQQPDLLLAHVLLLRPSPHCFLIPLTSLLPISVRCSIHFGPRGLALAVWRSFPCDPSSTWEHPLGTSSYLPLGEDILLPPSPTTG